MGMCSKERQSCNTSRVAELAIGKGKSYNQFVRVMTRCEAESQRAIFNHKDESHVLEMNRKR